MKKAAIFYKRSQYSIYVEEKKDKHITGLVRSLDPLVVGMLASHEQNQRTLDIVTSGCSRAGLECYLLARGKESLQDETDLVISVGGDGTFLDAQGLIKNDTPILGVNSDPTRSHGHFCVANADTLGSVLARLSLPSDQKTFGAPEVAAVQRLAVALNGNLVSSTVLNEILFAHPTPACVSSYMLNGESQKSSGVWVSSASGSSGAMLSAGGRKMHWSDHRLQFRVREPFQACKRYKNLSGYVGPGNSVSLVSFMKEGAIFLDGTREVLEVALGDTITVSTSKHPLKIVKILS